MNRSRISARDLVDECVAALVVRPGRTCLTALGVVLGIGTFVSVVGLAATASGQIGERFDVLAATTVLASDGREDLGERFPIPPDADARARSLNGVRAAGSLWTVRQPGLGLEGAPTTDQPVTLDLMAVSAGAWEALQPRVVEGRTYDEVADAAGLHVAVLGSSAAVRLGISTLETRPAITIDDVPFTVVGVVDDVVRSPEVLLAVSIPRGTAEAIWGQPQPNAAATEVVSTDPGAATQVADELPYALSPEAPGSLRVTPPPDPRTLRDSVAGDLNTLFVVLALVCLLVGAVGIANTTLVAVLERTSEIGLRRALGATPHQVATQVMVESATLGGLGGLVGTSVGVVVVVTVSTVREWTAVMSPLLTFGAPGVGVLIGTLAGLYPALRAARIEPSQALRQ
ncbi:MAG: ABC transporter permease [Propionibacteriales bacterium]|nr:ABC transporter permease [Propionibacteriales bacterium]